MIRSAIIFTESKATIIGNNNIVLEAPSQYKTPRLKVSLITPDNSAAEPKKAHVCVRAHHT